MHPEERHVDTCSLLLSEHFFFPAHVVCSYQNTFSFRHPRPAFLPNAGQVVVHGAAAAAHGAATRDAGHLGVFESPRRAFV